MPIAKHRFVTPRPRCFWCGHECKRASDTTDVYSGEGEVYKVHYGRCAGEAQDALDQAFCDAEDASARSPAGVAVDDSQRNGAKTSFDGKGDDGPADGILPSPGHGPDGDEKDEPREVRK